MNWKEFLKPDIIKIVIAIGIFLILVFQKKKRRV